MLVRPAALLAALVLLSSPAEAQRPARRIVSRGWPSAAAPAARSSDALADSLAPVAPTATSEATGPLSAAPEAPGADARPEAAPALSVSGRTDLRVSLPAGWRRSAVDESRLPTYALYAFTGPLRGVTLRVEQITGLNPLEEQQWRVGQTAHGYHGARPVGTIAVPLQALAAFETAGPGAAGNETGGAAAFLQRGRTFWTVSIEAPAPVWRTRRADLVALMAGVSVPDAGPLVYAPGRPSR